MKPTKWLSCLPSVKAIMDLLPCEIERSRLMRIQPGSMMPEHEDVAPYWDSRVRIHVPIHTNPDVVFKVGRDRRHMKAGEGWIFNTAATHSVVNKGKDPRIHLVMDSLGSHEFFACLN